MDAVRVYRYELYDKAAREFLRQPRYATEEAITRLGGVVMYSTARQAPGEEVGPDGQWRTAPMRAAAAVHP